ncbi:caspase family protein [Marivita sp. XM-24bin2]|uniref:caspase family protein n=1 Tax=Marivita sp. XM-24bin2 TaxID=2133951 RepID=UPI0025BE6967|nr:caspase family protein [Marivita sp. XM-24bin2]
MIDWLKRLGKTLACSASAACLVAAGATSAEAQQRIALVIGNSTYESVSALDNPSRDAELIASTLEQIDFQVTLLIDATQIEMKRALSDFGRNLRNGGADTTGLFYYAGHGVQSFGNNYLLPIDASLSRRCRLGSRRGRSAIGIASDGVRAQPHEFCYPGCLSQQSIRKYGRV